MVSQIFDTHLSRGMDKTVSATLMNNFKAFFFLETKFIPLPEVFSANLFGINMPAQEPILPC
jgi:hypothetical protein